MAWTQLATIPIVDFVYQTLRSNDDGQNYSTWWTDMESSVLVSSFIIFKCISSSGDEDKQTRTNGGSDYIL